MRRFSVEIRERNGELSIYEMPAETPEDALHYVWEKLAGTGCETTGRVDPAVETDPDIGELPYWAEILPTPRSYQIATWLTGFSLVAVFG